jgi:hypothetical protein
MEKTGFYRARRLLLRITRRAAYRRIVMDEMLA